MARWKDRREKERKRRGTPVNEAYLYHGIVSSSHSPRRSTLPRLMANHHYLITRPFFVRRSRVSVVRGGTSLSSNEVCSSSDFRKSVLRDLPHLEFETRIIA